jgi:hypothetical protein
MSQSFTKSKKGETLDSRMSFQLTPGPGAYEHIELEPQSGKFMVSRFSDSRFCKINPKTPRFLSIKETPGPLTYREGDSLSKDAKYQLSQHWGTGTRAFPHSSRNGFTDWVRKRESVSPGPGFYEQPSDFGVYSDARYYRTLRKFKSSIMSK